MKRKVMQGVAAMLILAALVFAAGCGGSGSSTPTPAPDSGSSVSGNAK